MTRYNLNSYQVVFFASLQLKKKAHKKKLLQLPHL
jgi:hypothetical protein